MPPWGGQSISQCSTKGSKLLERTLHTDTRHCQVDVERIGSAADEAMTQTSDSGTRHVTPDPEGTGAQQAMVDGSQ